MLLRIILLYICFFCLGQLQAQDKNDFRLGIAIGLFDFAESKSFGPFLNVEPKVRFSKNTTLGLRLGMTLNSQTIESSDVNQFEIDPDADNSVFSFVPAFDYSWNKKRFRPHIGGGIGCHVLASYIEAYRIGPSAPTEERIIVRVNHQLGLLFRAGIELGKSRLEMEYNLVPIKDLETASGEQIGTLDSSYLGLSIGWTIGG